VSSRQTKNILGLNRKEPKLNLFHVISIFLQCFEHVSKQPKQTFLFRNKPKQSKKIVNWTPKATARAELLETDSSRCITKLFQTGTHRCSTGACRKTRPGAAQRSSRLTRHCTAQSSCRQTRPSASQSSCRKTCRCSIKALLDGRVQRQQRPLVDWQYRWSPSCCRPYTSWQSTGCCWINKIRGSTSSYRQDTSGDTTLQTSLEQTRQGIVQSAVEETRSS